MNHLGSGHVLTNNRQPSREDKSDKRRETVNPRNTAHSPPTVTIRSTQKQFLRKSHERERFRLGWMLTLVRQLVELEKRRRDYCSDPREPPDGR
ncbi:hypothetical protein, partial [Streptomyces milbemycinicus]|uniref:hypothetical protein n=1 Tax=Streptomyces milbemycinicus TaxID=476552 RepID=UPI001B7FF12B